MKEKLQRNTERLRSLITDLLTNKSRLNEINQEKGAFTWLSTLPVKEEIYSLSEEEFWDLLKIRYGWQLSRLPNMCSCGAKYDLQHSLSRKEGGFVSLRHNHEVRVEPPLETLADKTFDSRLTNVRDEVRLDIRARDFGINTI